jgi:hypothetical protein
MIIWPINIPVHSYNIIGNNQPRKLETISQNYQTTTKTPVMASPNQFVCRCGAIMSGDNGLCEKCKTEVMSLLKQSNELSELLYPRGENTECILCNKDLCTIEYDEDGEHHKVQMSNTLCEDHLYYTIHGIRDKVCPHCRSGRDLLDDPENLLCSVCTKLFKELCVLYHEFNSHVKKCTDENCATHQIITHMAYTKQYEFICRMKIGTHYK